MCYAVLLKFLEFCLNNNLRHIKKARNIEFNLSHAISVFAVHEFDWLISVSWQAEVCAGTVAEVIQSVVNGADGCVFCFGHSKLGKRQKAVNLFRIYIYRVQGD